MIIIVIDLFRTKEYSIFLYNVVLTPADHENHVEKHGFKVPFVCGARDLGEALRRISEGASMIRTKGEAGTGKYQERPISDVEIVSHVGHCLINLVNLKLNSIVYGEDKEC